MKVRLLTLVAISALAAPLAGYADTANVNVYGTMNITFLSLSSSGSLSSEDISPRMRLNCNGCNFGVKGTEELADGMKAIWQVETGVGFMTSATSNNFQLRNSGVGMSGSWGQLMFGQWDTPFKIQEFAVEPTWGTGVGYLVGVAESPGLNTTSSSGYAPGALNGGSDVSFNRRQSSSFWYNSPNFSGFDFNVMYSGSGAKDVNYPNPGIISATVNYKNDMFFGGVGYETHTDNRSTATFTTTTLGTAGISSSLSAPTLGTSDSAMRIQAGVTAMEGLTVAANYNKLSYANKIAAGEDTYGRGAITGVVKYKMSDWDGAFAYSTASTGTCTLASGTACTVTDNGGNQMVIKIGHSYSKRTDVFLVYSKVSNGANGTYNFAVSSDQPKAAVAGQGTSMNAMGLGLRHTF